ncbi:MAG: phosphoribosylglycinamide formyltransferase, partial [Acidobacteria bacterium]|nr:phosphoribosylglycinamide formyltransferase [Acidobacteriota bacterium]
MSLPTLGVLISGRGSNLQAIVDAIADEQLAARIGVVVSNIPGAFGLERATAAGIPTVVVEHGQFESRDAFDATLVDVLRRYGVELVCLAGFMRLLGPRLVQAFPHAILNIHPSLLPSFP